MTTSVPIIKFSGVALSAGSASTLLPHNEPVDTQYNLLRILQHQHTQNVSYICENLNNLTTMASYLQNWNKIWPLIKCFQATQFQRPIGYWVMVYNTQQKV